MDDIAYSVSGVPIRLTAERWKHIVENHDDMAGHYEDCLDIVENPDLVLRGDGGALIAVRGVARRRYLAVVYKELSRSDGFIISAYFISKIPRRNVVWRRR